ncbi:MAG: cation transporter [Candidatus Saccharimonadales bacterium]
MSSSNSETIENGIKQGLWLEYFTLSWNVVSVCVLAIAATRANSIALVGFGIDSSIEILASAVVVWQLRGINKSRETKALKIISVAFACLVLYVLVQALRTLASNSHPLVSHLGMDWLLATFVVMLLLAFGKFKVGKKINNPVLLTEGKVTLIDAYVAGAILIGITLNATLGWWWADPIAGLVIVYYGLKEARNAWFGSKHTAAYAASLTQLPLERDKVSGEVRV